MLCSHDGEERRNAEKIQGLSEKEILALAISSEEEDGRIYGEFADALRESYPATAQMFEEMREEEAVHRDRLLAMFRQRFGDHIPLIRRENVKGFLQRRPNWLIRPLGVNVARRQAEVMELEAQRFYQRAIARTSDASTRELLNKLADEERKHTQTAGNLEEKHLTQSAKQQEDESHRKLFLAADCAARASGINGWVGFDAGAAICGGVRHAQKLGGVSGGLQHRWEREFPWASRNHYRMTDR